MLEHATRQTFDQHLWIPPSDIWRHSGDISERSLRNARLLRGATFIRSSRLFRSSPLSEIYYYISLESCALLSRREGGVKVTSREKSYAMTLL